MAVEAKFRCTGKHEQGGKTRDYLGEVEGKPKYGEARITKFTEVRLQPVMANEPDAPEENKMFGEATPSGELRMQLVGPQGDAAAAEFEIGQDYYVNIRKARK